MHLVDGSCFGPKEAGAEVHKLYSNIGKDVYAVGVRCADDLYADYYFDGEKELKFFYKCRDSVADMDAFSQACRNVMKHVSSTTCRNVKSVYLDYMVLARAFANKTLSGSSEMEDLDGITGEYLPVIAAGFETDFEERLRFKSIDTIGFYPIVADAGWYELVASCGAKTIQLRIKSGSKHKIEEEVGLCSEIAAKYGAKLIVNDHWEVALKYKAYGVHLGQDDLKTADLNTIRESETRLGISTHCFHELATALFYKPSYIAFGAIYGTTSKEMEFKAQSTSLLSRWVKCATCPVVAIGGITLSNVEDVVRTGVSGIAVISAVTHAADPKQAVKEFIRICGA
ncbi:thiamine phosphate synthase [Anaplasma bovis]|uniref:thiamine phosphate synthase n=1 Tax=Anaplasma bovis TaxID=186733 RepID=UPI002FF2EB29